MALQTVWTQVTVMNIFVARHAVLRQAEKCLVQVLHFDEGFFLRLNVRGCVAFAALDARVFPNQRISRLLVVKIFRRRNPMDQRKVLAVVVGMAFRTGLFIGKCGVKPTALG